MRIFIFFCLWLSLATGVHARESLTVAVSAAPPWVQYNAERPPEARTPAGFNIDLWQAVADNLDVDTRWLYRDSVAEVIQTVKAGEADAGLVNFPPSGMKLGVQFMVLSEQSMGQVILQSITKLLKNISLEVLWVPLLIFLGAGIVRWLLDRRQPPEYQRFPRSFFRGGWYEACWWNISLLVDWEGADASRGLARYYDLFWHLSGLVLLSGLIGVLSASFTLESINERIDTVEDIKGKAIAVPAEAVPIHNYLRRRDETGQLVPVQTLEEAAQRLLATEVQAIAYHSAALQMLAKRLNVAGEDPRVRILPGTFNRQHYAVMVAAAHPHAVAIAEQVARFDRPHGLEESLAKRLAAKWQVDLGD